MSVLRCAAAIGVALLWALLALPVRAQIRFAREIQPLLSDRCYRCHGPDARARQANLRLDTESGVRAAFGGANNALRRMRESNPGLRMPPPSSHLEITPESAGEQRSGKGKGCCAR